MSFFWGGRGPSAQAAGRRRDARLSCPWVLGRQVTGNGPVPWSWADEELTPAWRLGCRQGWQPLMRWVGGGTADGWIRSRRGLGLTGWSGQTNACQCRVSLLALQRRRICRRSSHPPHATRGRDQRGLRVAGRASPSTSWHWPVCSRHGEINLAVNQSPPGVAWVRLRVWISWRLELPAAHDWQRA